MYETERVLGLLLHARTCLTFAGVTLAAAALSLLLQPLHEPPAESQIRTQGTLMLTTKESHDCTAPFRAVSLLMCQC